MKIFIMSDLEGVCGVFGSCMLNGYDARYPEARKYLTREANVCAKACKDMGVEAVYYQDGHGGASNIIWEELSADIDYCMMGQGGNDLGFLEQCDGMILLGAHAMAGTYGALLEHSQSSNRIQNYWVDGKKIGEIDMEAAMAGDKGVPVIMVSGDDYACKEAKERLPWVVTAEVKKAISCQGAAMLTPNKAFKVIYDKTVEAIRNIQNCQVYETKKPVRLVVEHTERSALPDKHAKPYMEIIDGRTFAVTGETFEEALYRSF